MYLKSIAGSIKRKLLSEYYGKLYNFDDLLDPSVYERKKQSIDTNSVLKHFFVIRRSYRGMGLFTYVCVFISFIAYAIEKGLIPIIDLKNSPNIYLSDDALRGVKCLGIIL